MSKQSSLWHWRNCCIEQIEDKAYHVELVPFPGYLHRPWSWLVHPRLLKEKREHYKDKVFKSSMYMLTFFIGHKFWGMFLITFGKTSASWTIKPSLALSSMTSAFVFKLTDWEELRGKLGMKERPKTNKRQFEGTQSPYLYVMESPV